MGQLLREPCDTFGACCEFHEYINSHRTLQDRMALRALKGDIKILVDLVC